MSSKFNLEAKQNAIEFRRSHGLDLSEALTLDRLLMRLGVLTVFRPLSAHFSGMAIKNSHGDRYILINSSHPIGKQHFTICHELYHLYIQDNFSFMVCDTGKFDYKSNRHEYFADLFAANLLMPEAAISELIPPEEEVKDKIKLETLIKVEQYLGSSRSALLYRLKSLGYISQRTVEQYKRNVKKSARLHGKSVALYEPDLREDHIGDYGDIARELFEANKISEGHYSSLLLDLGVDITNLEDTVDV